MERIKRISQIQENLMIARNAEKRKLSKGIKEKDKLKIGDMVLMRNQNRKSKMDIKWQGPFIVKETNKVGSCVISDVNNSHDMVVHRNNLKKILTEKTANKMLCEHPGGIEHEEFEDKHRIKRGRIVDIANEDSTSQPAKRSKVVCSCFYL